ITNYFSWRWILFVNVPVGIVLALVAPRALLAAGGRSGRLDLPGALAVTGGATLLVYSLSRASTHGWRDATTVATLVIALALLVAVGLFWLSGVTVHAGYASHVLGPLLVLAVGLGGVFVSTSVTVISGITARESGIASALLNVGRQLGGSLGIAVLGAVAGYA